MTEPLKLSEAEKEAIRAEKRRYNRRYYQQNKKEIRNYHKEWREKNPEKVKTYNQTHWLRKAGLKEG